MPKGYCSSYEELIDEEYFRWLCELVDADDPDLGYLGIMSYLYDTIFDESTAKLIPNDDNRIADGLSLRYVFCEDSRLDFDSQEFLQNKYPSLLEMMVSLARRIESSYGYMTTEEWFWEMMKNLSLDLYNDDEFYTFDGHHDVEEIVKNLMSRTYAKDGFGGLFPLKKCLKDQRKVEIWSQMLSYLIENEMY